MHGMRAHAWTAHLPQVAGDLGARLVQVPQRRPRQLHLAAALERDALAVVQAPDEVFPL